MLVAQIQTPVPLARKIVALAVVALSFAVGCPKRVPPPDDAIESPSKLESAVRARTEQFPGARFKEVVLDYFGENERVKVRQLILVEQPDRVRVQTRLPGSNEIVSLLVSDGDTFAVHRRDNNRYVTGPPTPANINRLLPVDLSARDVVRVMLGGAPWDRFGSAPGSPSLEWDDRNGKYTYAVPTAEGGRLEMRVRPTDYAVTAVTEYGPDGSTRYKYRTDDWKRFGDRALPEWRRFVWPDRDLDFSLAVGTTEVGVELPNRLFRLEPPAGSTIIRVDRKGEPIEPSSTTQ